RPADKTPAVPAIPKGRRVRSDSSSPRQTATGEVKPNTPQAVRYRQVEDLFHLALDQGPDCLRSACAGDPALRAEVEALLVSYRSWSASLPPVSPPALPRFGAYQCDEILGSGGMGMVYRAHRDDGQFRHAVAIKVLRGSLRSEWYRERFLSERQI